MDLIDKFNYRIDKWRVNSYLKENVKFLNNKDFTIISNNCWGGIVSQHLNLPYLSPTVNLYMFIPDYIIFLKDLEKYLSMDLEFAKTSKYEQVISDLKIKPYPIGILGNIELHFIHYQDADVAYKTWNSRVKRVNINNLFVTMSQRDLCTVRHIEVFDNLPFENKVCFTADDFSFKSTVKIRKYSVNGEVAAPDLISEITYRKLELVNWLNNGKRK